MLLRGGYTTGDPRLDRLPEFDDRSRDFPIRALVGFPELRSRSWRLTERLDQGREGACVGFAWAHEAAAEPRRRRASDEDARGLYRRAQQLDEWAGEAYEGTSVLAGAKAAMERGWLVEYRWAFGVDEVLAALSEHGPVVLGLPWLDSMFAPGPDGFLDCTGRVSGGHAIVARGLRLRKGEEPAVVLRNSWGRSWGRGGDCLIRASDLRRLLEDRGEACVPVTR